MKPRIFLFFVGPSLFLMTLFIAVPLVSVFVQSFFVTHQVFHEVTTKSCSPGFMKQTCTESTRTEPVLGPDGVPKTETHFVGLGSYRSLLKPAAVKAAFSAAGNGIGDLLNIDFYRALRFTLTFTLVTLPLVIGFGMLTALALNNVTQAVRGPLIFTFLLPFIITPIIGALAMRWLFVGNGIMADALNGLLSQHFAILAHGWSLELLMLFFRVWYVAPFAFVIFYAGLQTVDRDVMESAIVDGASRVERLRYVIIPHLAPLITFVALIHLMDAYRVFEEIIGFSSQAHRISLQWLTYDLLVPDSSGNRAISRASASSMLTLIGIVILLIPLLRRAWREHLGRG
ncbi:carbohydrate ABC transporter permease [Pararhizobium mangrovi]|uniref:Sugar ABC transporter permease n=1 Tax=Pararhizobium mangrovi TaxID=2590452 RepID=A0A506TYJ9_9HYPH|nr:sugar ABC transporter permease [Pararhizobium mangrovi]TPW27152.1 sugar ABC transporter permease [Pararhizobium mangrovi]